MSGIGSALATLHGWVGIVSALLAAALVVLGALDGLGRVRARRGLDRLVLALLAATGAGAVLGIGVLVAVRPPSDVLHLVYGAAAVLAVPAARSIAGMRRSPRLGWWLAAGGLVTLGALLRLWATGG
jgi:hypothetical protein